MITTTNLVSKKTDGNTPALRNISKVCQGDTLITGAGGMPHLCMLDRSIVLLRKETEFKIAEFSFNVK